MHESVKVVERPPSPEGFTRTAYVRQEGRSQVLSSLAVSHAGYAVSARLGRKGTFQAWDQHVPADPAEYMDATPCPFLDDHPCMGDGSSFVTAWNFWREPDAIWQYLADHLTHLLPQGAKP